MVNVLRIKYFIPLNYVFFLIFSEKWILLFVLMTINSANAQQATSLIGFYNCENLFDTINDKGIQDGEYLPTSKKHWNTDKYHHKLRQLSRAILAIGEEWEGPDIIGLCEVENKQVIKDLIQKTYLQQYDYRVIHQDSQDKRGIDVAMVYKASAFEPVNHKYIPVPLKEGERPTREILYVKGRLKKTVTIHLFYNHWPSRFGGVAQTKAKRTLAAKTLRRHIDSIFHNDVNPFVLVSGDFNDPVLSENMQTHLQAHVALYDTLTKPYLVNTSFALKKRQKLGTHKYQGRWSFFDQWIVSDNLLANTGKLSLHLKNSFVLQKDWLLHEDVQAFDKKPFRSYAGNAYLGGFSDHLPVYIKLHIR